MSLTTRDHTMSRGAYEAIYQGTPVIVSDWPVLRDAFPEGAIHVDNTAAQIAAAIRSVCAEPAAFRSGAARLRAAKLREWQRNRAAFLSRLADAATGIASTHA